MNRYYKNFILCGDIDEYCLLCKESFYLIPDIEKHIRWEVHRKNMKDLTYLPKFRNDFIYKVENNYYCEKCNVVTFNMTSLKEHVKCEKHVLLKSNPDAVTKKPAGLYDSGHVVINKVIINKAQWNSIVDRKCFICNINVENVDEHIKIEKHIINLIQSETKYTENQYYRKINDEIYHCFACKKIFNAANFESHWVTCENNDEIEIKQLKEAKKVNKNIGALSVDLSRMAKIEKNLVEMLHDFYIIDEVNNAATCKCCRDFIAIDFKSMIEHMTYEHDKLNNVCVSSSESEEDGGYRVVIDNGKRRSELAKYGKSISIKLNHNGSKGYCTVCDRFMSASKKVFRQHSRGVTHRGHLERLGVKTPGVRDLITYVTKDVTKYITELHYSKKLHGIWVNGEFSLSVDSYFLLLKIENNPHFVKTKCHVCNEFFNQGEERDHCLSRKHLDNFTATKVIVKEMEFIRELQPNLFHCGCCNVTISYSDVLEKHVQTRKHVQLKTESRMLTHLMNYSRILDPSVMELPNIDCDVYMKLLSMADNYFR